MKTHRLSNIELLRIVSMFMIVLYHCAYHSAFQLETASGATQLTVRSLYLLGQLGVNTFMLISGYFTISSEFNWKKVLSLVIEVQFYWWASVLFASWMKISPFPSGKELFLAFFPVITNRWWFITAYIIVYILSPFINATVHAIDDLMYRRLLLTLLTMYCIIPTFFGIFFDSTETLLYYNRLIWLVILYLAGGYMSRVRTPGIKAAASLVAVSALIMVGTIPLAEHYRSYLESLGTQQVVYFMTPNNIPMLCMSIGLFGLFAHAKIAHSRLINTVASTTLGIYLSSDSFLNGWLWRDVFRCAEYPAFPEVILRILGATMLVYCVCAAVDLLRQLLFRGVAKIWRGWTNEIGDH